MGINRPELATFLRTRRARRRPHEVGLPEGPNRRTPGLRREEVAVLASISADYYIRLEQGRGPHPSKAVLGALARALMLTADERTYLFHLAGEAPPDDASPAREVPAAVLRLLASLTDTPAYVMDAKYDLLAHNEALGQIMDLEGRPAGDRNMIRWMFTSAKATGHWDNEDHAAFARASVADLRAAAARYPNDPGIHALVAELQATSPRFARLWADHEVHVRRSVVKTVGDRQVECQVLHIPQTDQRLVVYVPVKPGDPVGASPARPGYIPRP